jgi:arylsulfatase A-like enzyme
MADDMGYSDLSSFGGREFKTPNIDQLAEQGIRLTNSYSNAAVCSATRTALITGRYQRRTQVGQWEPMGPPNLGLPKNIPTLPSMLKDAGYRTALVGKWHLGFGEGIGPLHSGYEDFYGILHGGADYFTHRIGDDPKMAEYIPPKTDGLFENEKQVEHSGYMTDLLTDHTIKLIEEQKDDGRPLYISLHYTAPHWPWEGPEDEVVAKTLTDITHKDGGSLKTYAEMMVSMDNNVGKVLKALEKANIADNTIVIYTSDNGGERYSDTWPFIGMKTELLEGGIRVPVLIRWPNRIPEHLTSEQMFISMDWVPTLLAAAGQQAQIEKQQFDGENLLAELMNQTQPHERTLFWSYNTNHQAAVRDGDWKYLKIAGVEQLSNLAQDPRERANLKDKYPEIFNRLKEKYRLWESEMLPYGKTYSHSVKQEGKLADRY